MLGHKWTCKNGHEVEVFAQRSDDVSLPDWLAQVDQLILEFTGEFTTENHLAYNSTDWFDGPIELCYAGDYTVHDLAANLIMSAERSNPMIAIDHMLNPNSRVNEYLNWIDSGDNEETFKQLKHEGQQIQSLKDQFGGLRPMSDFDYEPETRFQIGHDFAGDEPHIPAYYEYVTVYDTDDDDFKWDGQGYGGELDDDEYDLFDFDFEDADFEDILGSLLGGM